ncbi:MAG TPA: Ig-like domain-containing protein, partial [Anaerolineales bacterium]
TVGYTPQLVVGVWLGYARSGQANAASTARVSPSTSADLWHAVIQYATQNTPALGWTAPSGISKIEVCDPSGMLPTPECPNTVQEVFLSGSEPTQNDNLYRKVQINRETGRLATLFTPPELVEEHVYLFPPAEASGWARQAGLDIPPDGYDVIAYAGPAAPYASSYAPQIDSPQMFAAVHGQVQIKGSALGTDFSYYRLQAGAGLNPQSWTQIGQDVTHPVSGDTLATWDASQLDGLYAIQLLVVHKNQRVDTVVLQVAVDNQPPEATILNPVAGQVVDAAQNPALTLQASASDNLGVEKLQFFLDGKPLASMAQPPYAYSWPTQKGKHTLRVLVTDRAGSTNESSADFEVK